MSKLAGVAMSIMLSEPTCADISLVVGVFSIVAHKTPDPAIAAMMKRRVLRKLRLLQNQVGVTWCWAASLRIRRCR